MILGTAGCMAGLVRIIEANDLLSAVNSVAGSFRSVGDVRQLLLERGQLLRLDSAWAPTGLAAVDTAFPKSPVYLVGASLSLVALASIVSREDGLTRNVRTWLLFEEQGELDQDYVAAFARLVERREAIRILDTQRVELLLIDGEVVPRKGKSPLWEEVVNLSKRLIARRGHCIVGVLKRSYSSSIARRLGLQVSDRSLASMALKRGEAVYAGHGVPELQKRGCLEALYKPLRGLPTAVRVEMCGCDPLTVLSWLARAAGPSGLPWPVDLVDTLAKREASKVSTVEAMLLSKLARRELQHMAYTANPQETMRRRRETQ